MPSEVKLLAEGDTCVLLVAPTGYQIWSREIYESGDFTQHSPDDEFILTEVGRRAALQAFADREPEVAARSFALRESDVEYGAESGVVTNLIHTSQVPLSQMCANELCREIGLPTDAQRCSSCGSETRAVRFASWSSTPMVGRCVSPCPRRRRPSPGTYCDIE